MIEYIRGELAELSPATAVIDCNGVGYAANISLNTYSAIQGKKTVSYIFTRRFGKTLMCFTDLPRSRSGDFPVVDFRLRNRGEHGTYDSLGALTCRTGERNQHRKREYAENGERYRAEDCATGDC